MQLELATRIDGPVAVIGDLHGQVEKLLTILDKLRALPDYDRRWIVCIGDLVDRGPDPIQHRRTAAIAGNHDLAMAAALGWLPTPEYSDWGKRWLDHYDSQTTFASYGATFGDLHELAHRVPDRHRAVIAGLPWCIEHPKFFFVHAGLEPNSPFAIQQRILRQKDFSLNRPPWLCSKSLVSSSPPADCPLTVVSGHVQVPQAVLRPNRILVDTTGGIDGDLSCVLLPEGHVITSGQGPDRFDTAEADPAERSWWKLWGK